MKFFGVLRPQYSVERQVLSIGNDMGWVSGHGGCDAGVGGDRGLK